MKKGFIIILFIILAILIGCQIPAQKNLKSGPIKKDSNNVQTDVKKNLSELEETYPELEYNTVLKEQSPIIKDGMSVTKFRQFVIFSDMKDDLTYTLIDNDIRNTIDAMSNKLYMSKQTIYTSKQSISMSKNMV